MNQTCSRITQAVTIICALTITSLLAKAVTPVLQPDTTVGYGGYNEPGDTIGPVSVADKSVPFKKALRITRAKPATYSYAAAVVWTTKTPVKRDDLLVATVYVRSLRPQPGGLKVELMFQLSDTPYTFTLTSSLPTDTTTWKKYAIPFRANGDYPSGQSSLQLRYALAAQGFEIGGVSVTNHGKVADPIPPAIIKTFAYYYPDRDNIKATWRKAALKRIDSIRKGNMTIKVVDAKGKVVKGAKVSVQQTASPFVWGTATSAISMVCKLGPGDSNRPCNTTDQQNDKPITGNDIRRLRKEMLANFNGLSFYNDLKWTEWFYDRKLALDGIAWLKRNRMPLTRGHNLIWPSFEPDYLMPRDVINKSTTATAARTIIAKHMAEQPGALKGQVPEWDVINEPYTNFDIQGRIAIPGMKAEKRLLPTSVVADWFKIARKADPKALLFVNDYAILENLNPSQQRYDLALVKYLKGLAAPIDGIGFQGHFGSSGLVVSDMQRVIDEFSPLVKTMSITEFDFTTLDPELQADVMEDIMTFAYSQPKMNLFQMWGFWDGDHWLGSGPLYDRAWRLKPSGAVWKRLTQNTWRTKTSATTGATGEARLRAFYGTYALGVTVGSKTCKSVAKFTKTGTVVTLRAVC